MRTAVDTNVLSSILSREAGSEAFAAQLQHAGQRGALVVSAPVYSELLSHPHVDEAFLAYFLEKTGIAADFALDASIWREAGLRFARHAQRRRQARTHAQPRRILADFVIGAHALFKADLLITADKRRYATDFPELRLL